MGETGVKVTSNQKVTSNKKFISGSQLVLILLILVSIMTVLTFKKFLDVGMVMSPSEAEIKKLTKIVNKNPNSLDLRLKLAYSFQKAKRYDEAITQYNEVLNVDNGNQGALYNLAVIAREQREFDEALRLLSTLIAQNPGHILGSIELGDMYLQKHEYDEAIRVVDAGIKNRPSVIELHYIKARALEGKEEYNAAVAEYREVLRYFPDHKKALEAIRRIY